MEKELSEQEKDLLYLFQMKIRMILSKIIKSLEDSGALVDGVTETIKDEVKKQEGGFLGALLAPLAASLVKSVISSVGKDISRRGVRRAGRGYMDKTF